MTTLGKEPVYKVVATGWLRIVFREIAGTLSSYGTNKANNVRPSNAVVGFMHRVLRNTISPSSLPIQVYRV